MSWRDWPIYSAECRQEMDALLAKGGTLSAYRANPLIGPGPEKDSWAWKAERLAEEIHEVKHVIMAPNGTVALTTLLQVLYPSGGVITVPALTFSATVTSALMAGLKVRFGDVDIPSCIMQVSGLNDLPVELFGQRAGTGFVADSCQAVGNITAYRHGVWSFNGRKNVPAGEGGAIYTQDDRVAGECRLRLNHRENFSSMGYSGNGRMNEQTALLVYYGLKVVRSRNARRQLMAQLLNDTLEGLGVITPNTYGHALYTYPLILPKDMPKVAKKLMEKGVDCQPGYIQPTLDKYPAFQGCATDGLPNTHALSSDRLLLFPQVTPTTNELEMEWLGSQIRRAVRD